MMMSTPHRKSAKPRHSNFRPLLVAAMLLSSNWFGISPLLAQSAPPGAITNKATGSFIDELDDSNTIVPIESNTVQVTVVEVAGITVTDGGSSGSTVTGGIVYFDFVLTNVGNDITQFFIPGTPSTIAGGTQTGAIKILSYDADGSGTSAAVALDVTVPAGGGKTGTLLGSVATANNGVIPVGATIRIRVPITITATSGNVDVKMGDTTQPNGQNEAYISGNKDIYTADNLDTVSGETASAPANGEREASLTQSLPISITTNTTNAPMLTCSSDRRLFNTAYDGNSNPPFFTTGRDNYWDAAIGTDAGPPPTTGWIDAYNVESSKPGAWIKTPYNDSAWISNFIDGKHTADIDIYFRYQFNLASNVDVSSFQLMMDFFGDNSISDIFINGVSQRTNYPTVLPQAPTSNPYYFQGYNGSGKAALTLTNNWQTGSNEIIVQVKSGPDFVGFAAESQPSYLCKSDAGDAPISYGTAPHAILTTPKVSLGSIVPDADNYRDAITVVTNPPYNDNTNGGDEDAVSTALKVPIAGNYNLSVPVVNTSGGSATLHGWIDFNKNGKFEAGEYQSIAVANSATTASLNWTVPSGTTLGSSFARFRLTTTTLTDNGTTTMVDERSILSANDGEVEDYSIDLVGNPNLLLVKRITAINGLPQKRNGESLANYENEAANLYDDNANATPVAPNLRPTTNKWPLIPNTTHPALIGAIDGGTIKPTDSIEYTIYFLSTGDIPAKSVLFCDRVPQNVTFIPTAFNSLVAGTGGLAGADRGIAVNFSGTLKSYTNIGNDDFARYFPPGIEPTTVFPKVNCGGTNTNGAVVVNFGDIPISTPGSYGFVRFQGQVK
jgi:uncharacterized repeat protein (TIGR01451 family)